jgi:peptidylprolyl isomerase
MTADSKPTVAVPTEDPPTNLLLDDIDEGTGPVAVSGSTVQVHYVGVAWSTKAEFDSSWDRGDHFSFVLGKGQVIAGWDQGVLGMRVGGRRRLTIPPSLGYGATGAGLFIKPNETLVFVVDLAAVDGVGEDGSEFRTKRRLFGGR